MPKPITDLTNIIFGELTVIKLGNTVIDKKGGNRQTWLCKCSCGNNIEVLPEELIKNHRKSCGCKSFIPMIGNKYGYLTVIEESNRIKGKGPRWKCLCDCGNTHIVSGSNLRAKRIISCGCYQYKTGKQSHIWKGCGELSSSFISSISCGARRRGIEFNLTIEYLWDLFLKQDRKCALSGDILIFAKSRKFNKTQTASLDRIDSSKGYVEGNVQWVHKDVNTMKWNKSDKDFIDICKKCVLNSYLKNDKLRPSFDEYFMNIALDVSLRSDDPDVKHGAVIVSNNNYIIGTGYNATIKGADPTVIPYNIRDEKRLWMIHAEENAILNSSSNPNNIGGAKIYITAKPCVNCLQRIINFGITQIYYINRFGSITENEKTEQMRLELIKMSKVSMIEIDIDSVLRLKGLK